MTSPRHFVNVDLRLIFFVRVLKLLSILSPVKISLVLSSWGTVKTDSHVVLA